MSTNAQVVLLTTYLYEYFLCYVSVSHSLSNLSLNNNIMIEKCCYDNSLDICHVYMSRVFLASFMITINCSNLVRLVVLVSLDRSFSTPALSPVVLQDFPGEVSCAFIDSGECFIAKLLAYTFCLKRACFSILHQCCSVTQRCSCG